MSDETKQPDPDELKKRKLETFGKQLEEHRRRALETQSKKPIAQRNRDLEESVVEHSHTLAVLKAAAARIDELETRLSSLEARFDTIQVGFEKHAAAGA